MTATVDTGHAHPISREPQCDFDNNDRFSTSWRDQHPPGNAGALRTLMRPRPCVTALVGQLRQVDVPPARLGAGSLWYLLTHQKQLCDVVDAERTNQRAAKDERRFPELDRP